MSKSQPSRRKQSRSTPRPKKATATKTHFTNADLRQLEMLANHDWPAGVDRQYIQNHLRRIASKVAALIDLPKQAQREKAARRKEIDENIKAFES